MFKTRMMSRVGLFFMIAALAATALAATNPTPSGKVSIESTSIPAGVGVSWGDGLLSFKGKQYRFSVDGLSLVDWGISKASAVGEVYNLTDVSKLNGNYLAGEAGFALVGGMGGVSMRNDQGVVLILRSVSKGAKLQLGPGGIKLTLKQ